MDSDTLLLSSFDEDILLHSSRIEGIEFFAEGFKEWTETTMPGPDQNSNRVLSLTRENNEVEEVATFSMTFDSDVHKVLPIETFGGIQEPIEAMIYKQPLSLFMADEEPVLQRVVIPYAAFDELDGEIKRLEWEFASAGGQEDSCLLLDDIFDITCRAVYPSLFPH